MSAHSTAGERPSMPEVAVVVVAHNGRERLAPTLASLDVQTLPPAGIVVVDNGSHDGTVEWLRDARPEVHVLPLSENVGFAAAANRGVAVTTTPYVALLNDDAEADPGWLRAMVEALEADAGAGSAAARMRCDPQRDVLDGAGDRIFWSGRVERRGRGEVDRDQYSSRERVGSACAGAALYRRAAWDEIGGFEEAFFAYHEDVEWGLRAQVAGWACVYVPDAIAYHVGAATSGRDGRPNPYFDALDRRNALWTMVACFPRRKLLRHAPSILVHQVLGFGASVRDRRLRAYLRGTGQGVFRCGPALRKRRRLNPNHPRHRARLAAVVEPDPLRALVLRALVPASRQTRE